MDGMQYSIQNISTGQQDLYFNRRPVSFIWEVPHLSPTACVVVQWNLVNTVINGPKIFGRNNEVAVLRRVSF